MGRVYLTNVSFKPVEKKQRHNTTSRYNKGRKLYALCTKDENDNFSAFIKIRSNGVTQKFTVPFSKNSYDITDKTKIFSKTRDNYNHIVCIIRTEQQAKQFPGIPELYTPLRKDYVYSGYLIIENNKKYFDIDECLESINFAEHLLTNIET